jgi:hypothetical protein
MARIVYSGLINSIRGSIGGTTFQKNAYGYTIKNKPNMIKPNTFEQQKIKQYFLQCVQDWTTLSSATQSDWNTYAATYPVYSKHNPTSQLSGYALFVKWNALRLISENPIVETPSGDRYTFPAVNIQIKAHGEPADALELLFGVDQANQSIMAILYLSRPVKDSKNFIGSIPKLIHTFGVTNTAIQIGTIYYDLFGTLPVAGEFIQCRITFFDIDAAQVYPTFSAKITVGSFTP